MPGDGMTVAEKLKREVASKERRMDFDRSNKANLEFVKQMEVLGILKPVEFNLVNPMEGSKENMLRASFFVN